MITCLLLAGLIKKISLYKMRHYPKPDSYIRNKIKIKLDLSNHAKKDWC